MQTSYTFNYLKIYFWQSLSIMLNLLSMFIVIPKLSVNPSIYGIYIICISLNIFLIYADFGFASAGYKYASESFAKNNLKNEIKIESFVNFILFIFIFIYFIIILFFALNPQLLIKGLIDKDDISIASNLLLILAFSSPLFIFQRFFEIVFGIRLKNYLYQRILIIFNIIKIISIFYFFQNQIYNIVSYFLFCQIMNLLAFLVSGIIIKIKFNYNYKLLFKYFKFSKDMYKKIKNLAFSSLFVTIAWILYYELDVFTISKLLGAKMIAVYSIGLTMCSFFRAIFGTLYSPFSARFNHFIGLNDITRLRSFIYSIIVNLLPLVVFPIVSLVCLMKPVVFSWVGNYYYSSIILAQLSVSCFIYSFISYPAGSLLIALEKVKLLYIINTIVVVIYWSGILTTYFTLGLKSFALFKFIAFTVLSGFYFVLILKFLEINIFNFLKKVINPIVIPTLFLIGILLYFKNLLPMEKGKLNLLIAVIFGGSASFIAVLLYYSFSTYFRNYINKLIKKIFVVKKKKFGLI